MNQPALVVHTNDMAPMTAGEIQQQVNTIQTVMKQVMQQDTHYGVIPGCKEPSLYKPGAEKIMATFRLAADPEVTDLSTEDEIRYRVKVRLVSPSGVFVGAGIGECSTAEEKYKWRRAVCEEEYEDTDFDRRREKWFKGWNNKPNYKQQQVRTNAPDLANTALKMAKKRALVDGILTATAASDIFTQDVEDLPSEYQETMRDQRGPSQNHHTEISAQAKPIIAELEKVAQSGWSALQQYWQDLSEDQRKLVGAEFGRIKKIAEAV